VIGGESMKIKFITTTTGTVYKDMEWPDSDSRLMKLLLDGAKWLVFSRDGIPMFLNVAHIVGIEFYESGDGSIKPEGEIKP
jgi:hypothetical protein